MKMGEFDEAEGLVIPEMVMAKVAGNTPVETILSTLEVGLEQLCWLLSVHIGEATVNSAGKVMRI